MGGSVSATLLIEEDQLFNGKLKGSLNLVNESKKNKTLQRATRVAMQFRARLRVLQRERGIETVRDMYETSVWKVGGEIANPGTILTPGENRFDFEFPLKDKPLGAQHPALKPASEWHRELGLSFNYVEYDYVVRAGSPPQTRDIVQYPKLLPKGETGVRHLNSDYIFAATPAIFGAM